MKKMIRLTESDLHRIVKESVNRILRETQLYNDNEDGYSWEDFKHRIINCQGLNPSEKHNLIKFFEENKGYDDFIEIAEESSSFQAFMIAAEEYFDDYLKDNFGQWVISNFDGRRFWCVDKSASINNIQLPEGWTWKDLYYTILHILNDTNEFSNNINYEDYENQM